MTWKEFPEGHLRISNNGNKIQYYLRKDSGGSKISKEKKQQEKDKRGTYIRKNQMRFICDLAQKDYNNKIRIPVQKQLKQVEKLLQNYEPNELENIYKNMKWYRKELINPIILSDEMYAEKWINEEYKRKEMKEIQAEILTENGEKVRSKSEKIIADKLKLMGIPYKYECPIYLKDGVCIYPDFTVLNKKKRKIYYWEHCGMMDDSQYCENTLRRIRQYERNGILIGDKLILSSETKKLPLNVKIIEEYIKVYLN